RCGRLEWSVLDWNEPAIQFYKKLGAVPMDQWTVFRVTDEKLKELAAGPPARRRRSTGSEIFQRNFDLDAGAASGRAFDGQRAADLADSFAHARETVVARSAGARRVEADAVVAQLGFAGAAAAPQPEVQLGGAGVAHGVEDRFAQ